MSRFTIIVAATISNGIGQNGRLPWRLPQEMAYFTKVTSNAPEGRSNVVIMGRNTWESIPNKFRPLRNRVNVVLSKKEEFSLEDVHTCSDLDLALNHKTDNNGIFRFFLIGGGSLYCQALMLPALERILLTRILSPEFHGCDTFLPDIQSEWKQSTHRELTEWLGFTMPEGIQEENGIMYEFQMWLRK